MKTLFYVPTEEEVEPHVKEATMWGLPIIHGVSEKLKEEYPDFVFPEIADIIKLPELSYVTRSSDDAVTGQPLAFLLVHEFDDLRKGGLELKVENARKREVLFENVEPQWVEMSRARWVIRISNVGKYRFTVSLNGEELNSDLFYAYKD